MQSYLRPILLVAMSAPAWCWGPAGHHIVALIAEQRLSPEARARVNHLLFDGKFTMAQISVCPDALRAAERGPIRPEEQYCRSRWPARSPRIPAWHYIDIPYSVQSGALDPYCPGGACITAKIAAFARTLHDSKEDGERRAALMYLVHFLGDINQPLHAIERNCDQGGNQEHVDFYLKDQERADRRLHAVWDSDLLDKAMADDKIADEVSMRTHCGRRSRSRMPGKWAQESVTQIAWDSHDLAVRYAYRGIPDQDFCAIREAMAKDPN